MQSLSTWSLIISLALVGLGCGTAAMRLPRWIPLPATSRFLLGFSCVPFVIAAWMLALSSIWPGGPIIVFGASPPLAALAWLGFRGWRDLVRALRQLRSYRSVRPHVLACAAAALIPLCVLSSNGMRQLSMPVLAFDAAQYLSEALPFAQARGPHAISGVRGTKEGTLRGDIHSFAWPAYLAYGLLFSERNALGYPSDYGARMAFQLTVIFMITSVLCLGAAGRLPFIGPVAVIFLFMVTDLGNISRSMSREGFRIIPLTLLVAVLYGCGVVSLDKRKLKGVVRWAPVLASIGAACVAGHTLGVPLVVVVTAAWILWTRPRSKSAFTNAAISIGAVAMGALAAGRHYVQTYLATGSALGDNVVRESVLAGTPLFEKLGEIADARLQGASTLWQRIAVVAERDGYVLSLPGILSALLILLVLPIGRAVEGARYGRWLALNVIIVAAIFFGVFDTRSFSLSNSFVMNFRYQQHWYPLLAAVTAFSVVQGLTFVGCSRWFMARWPRYIFFIPFFRHREGVSLPSHDERFSRSVSSGTLRRAALSIMAATAVVFLFDGFFHTVHKYWAPGNPRKEVLRISRVVNAAKTSLQSAKPHSKVLLEDGRFNYYLKSQAVLIYSKFATKLHRATSDEEVERQLTRMNIGVVMITAKSVPGWWDSTALYRYLITHPTKIRRVVSGEMYVFVIEDRAWMKRYRQRLRQTPI
jgi:hypothetical protein